MDLFKHLSTIDTAALFAPRKPVVIIGEHHSGKTLASLGLAAKAACDSNHRPVGIHLFGFEENPGRVREMFLSATRDMKSLDFERRLGDGRVEIKVWPQSELHIPSPPMNPGDIHVFDSLVIMSYPGKSREYETTSDFFKHLCQKKDVRVIAVCTPGYGHSVRNAGMVAKAYDSGQCFATGKVGGDLVLDVL